MSSDDRIDIPKIQLAANSGNMNCLLFSPLQMVSLGMTGNIRGSSDGTGINCITTDRETGLQSEVPVFQGYKTSDKNLSNNSQIACMVKLIKTTTPELSGIPYPQIDGLVVAYDCSDKETVHIFDNIRMSVALCGSPSRYYNRCYMTGCDYNEVDSELLTGRIFTGARAIYGERYYLVSLQYSKSLEHLFPIADTYFNLVNKLVPLQIAAPGIERLANGRNYLKCKVRRTNGNIQSGFIQLGPESMIIYKSPRCESVPSLIPYIIINFNSDGSDVLDAVSDTSASNNDTTVSIPVHDSFKTIRVDDLLAENPALSKCFLSDLNFERLTLHILYDLCKTEQQ